MSSVAIQGNAAGAGVFTVAAPNSGSSYTATLPTATTTLVGTDATQTLTNKTIQGGAITSGTAVASTSGTSIDFTSIPSWVKRITVMFQGVSTTGTSVYLLQVGSGSVSITGYNSAAGVIEGTTAYQAGGSTAGFYLANVSANTNTISGVATLVTLGSNIWVISGAIKLSSTRAAYFGGDVTLSGTLDRIRLTTVGGTDTFDAGSINILYEG